MVRAMHANLGLFDGKFNVDMPCERSFDLVFRDGACAGKRVEGQRESVYNLQSEDLLAFYNPVDCIKPCFRGKF